MPWQLTMPRSIAGLASSGQSAQALSPAAASSIDGAFSMDNDAFAAFYQRSARPLWAYLARVSGDPSLADDLVQEAYIRFLSADRAPLIAEGEVAQRRYLFRIATNLLRDHWRRPRASSIEDLPESFFAAMPGVDQHDSQALLTPALARMNPRERQLLWLAHAEGYSHREIAQIMGLASASIRLLLFRARRKMAAYLREPAPIHASRAAAPASTLRRQP